MSLFVYEIFNLSGLFRFLLTNDDPPNIETSAIVVTINTFSLKYNANKMIIDKRAKVINGVINKLHIVSAPRYE